MSSKLTFHKCSIEEWDLIVDNSYQSNFFVKSYFLKNSGTKFHLWKIMQGEEIKAGICLNVDDLEKNSIENEFVIHNGIFFNLDNNRILSKRREDEFQITSFAISNLVSKYNEIFLSLDPKVFDMRPFQWHNYNTQDPKFKISIKYTSILDLSEFNSEKDEDEMKIFKNLEPVRRYSIRQAKKEKFNAKFSDRPEKFLDLYHLDRYHLTSPSSTELDRLMEQFDLHEIIEEDLVEKSTQDKVDVYDQYLFIVLHIPKYNKERGKYVLNEFKIIL